MPKSEMTMAAYRLRTLAGKKAESPPLVFIQKAMAKACCAIAYHD
jgi:hypothetical protein